MRPAIPKEMSIMTRKIILAVVPTGSRGSGANNPITPIAKASPANA